VTPVLNAVIWLHVLVRSAAGSITDANAVDTGGQNSVKLRTNSKGK
jgi:hypothetical protein